MNAETTLTVPEWLNSLNELDIKSGGRPEVPDHILDQAREWLAMILVDVGEGLVPHIRQLERYSDASFRPPVSRCLLPWSNPEWPAPDSRFRYRERLSEQQMSALANEGISALKNPAIFLEGEPIELGRLLLNPYALFDLSDLITFTVPDAWQDRLASSGQQLVSQLNLEIPGA